MKIVAACKSDPFTLSFLIIFFSFPLWGQDTAPVRRPGVEGSECSTCHQIVSPLPDGHVVTAALNLPECRSCHIKGEETSLTGKLSLSHIHNLAGVTCAKCHVDESRPAAVPAKTCIGCHETSALAAATHELGSKNPHASPHWGENADCNLCHHEHAKSENACSSCHEENKLVVP